MPPSKRILVEVALLKALQARNAVSIDSVLQKLQSLRGESGGPASAPPAPLGPAAVAPPAPAAPAAAPKAAADRTQPKTSAPPKTPPHAPVAQAAAAAPPSAAVPLPIATPPSLGELWDKILESVGRASMFARSYLLEAHPVSLTQKILTIGFDPANADHLGLVDNPKNHALLQAKLQELGYPDLSIRFVTAAAPEGWVRTAAPVSAPEPPSPPAVTVGGGEHIGSSGAHARGGGQAC